MRRTGVAAVGVASLLVLGYGVAAASPAAADQVWHQAVGRADADAPCPTNTAEETASGWSEWAPSYAEWMNGGSGGFVCMRSNTWAKDSVAAGAESPGISFAAGCVARGGTWTYYIDFGDSFFVQGTGHGYLDAGCTEPDLSSNFRSLVYSPAPYDPDTLCIAAFGRTGGATLADNSIYICEID